MLLSYKHLEHDLYCGYRLWLLRDKHAAQGFRGKNKGQGFRAYLADQNIPARHAYRLIERYREFAVMWAEVHVSNEDLEPNPKMPMWLMDHYIMAGAIDRRRKRLETQAASQMGVSEELVEDGGR